MEEVARPRASWCKRPWVCWSTKEAAILMPLRQRLLSLVDNAGGCQRPHSAALAGRHTLHFRAQARSVRTASRSQRCARPRGRNQSEVRSSEGRSLTNGTRLKPRSQGQQLMALTRTPASCGCQAKLPEVRLSSSASIMWCVLQELHLSLEELSKMPPSFLAGRGKVQHQRQTLVPGNRDAGTQCSRLPAT